MKIEKAERSYQVTECDLKFGEQITLDGKLLIPAAVLDKMRAYRDALLNVINDIQTEINTPNRGTCDYFIVDRIEEIINKYNAESEEKE